MSRLSRPAVLSRGIMGRSGLLEDARGGNVEPETRTELDEIPFVERVFAIVRRIPPGRVTTYGRIASAVGQARSARMVGWALHDAPPDISEVAHRVVNRNGELTGGWNWGHPAVMRELLESEGISFIDDYQVDLNRHLWEPGEG